MLELCKVDELSDGEKLKIDYFIMNDHTNGEFINTLKYLSYHGSRFKEDSVAVIDKESHEIRGVMLATVEENFQTMMSHAGTTFAGPVVSRKNSANLTEKILVMMLDYYEGKYKKTELKLSPPYYTFQPNNLIGYFLLRRGYSYGMTALSNIIRISHIATVNDVIELCNSKRRNQLRKVMKKKMFQFREGSVSKDVWESMNRNIELKFGSHTTHTFDEIDKLSNMFPDHIKSFYVETPEKIYGAFGLVYCFKNVFHTQYLDLNYDFSSESPNLLLILELIMKARELGYEYFSFGASTEKRGSILNYNLYQYKAEYGGGDILLPSYTKENMI